MKNFANITFKEAQIYDQKNNCLEPGLLAYFKIEKKHVVFRSWGHFAAYATKWEKAVRGVERIKKDEERGITDF